MSKVLIVQILVRPRLDHIANCTSGASAGCKLPPRTAGRFHLARARYFTMPSTCVRLNVEGAQRVDDEDPDPKLRRNSHKPSGSGPEEIEDDLPGQHAYTLKEEMLAATKLQASARGQLVAYHLQKTNRDLAARVQQKRLENRARSFITVRRRRTMSKRKASRLYQTHTFELRRCEFVQLTAIDVAQQTFKGQILFEFWIPDGALDADLAKGGHEFPRDDDGHPTFRPPAGWYARQLDFSNAINYRWMDDPTVRKVGDDLMFVARFEGEWWESMEMAEFPFDVQDLTVSISMNCRTSGRTPVRLAVDSDAELVLNTRTFALHQLYRVCPNMSVEEHELSRHYPALAVTAVVARRPGFVLFNIAMPMGSFPMLAMCQFALPVAECETRLAVGLTLLLTSVAYKSEIGRMIPDVAYLTIIDKYCMLTAGVIYLMVAETAAVFWWRDRGIFDDSGVGSNDDSADLIDNVCFFVLLGFWLIWHVFLYCRHRVPIKAAFKTALDPHRVADHSAHHKRTTRRQDQALFAAMAEGARKTAEVLTDVVESTSKVNRFALKRVVSKTKLIVTASQGAGDAVAGAVTATASATASAVNDCSTAACRSVMTGSSRLPPLGSSSQFGGGRRRISPVGEQELSCSPRSSPRSSRAASRYTPDGE